MPNKEADGKKKGVDIAKLKEDHPRDPRIGQGYNDARGEIPEEGDLRYKNRKNNLGPEQKRDKV